MNQPREMGPSDRIAIVGDPGLAELIPTFLERRHQDVKTIKEAVSRGDFEAIRVLGHSMKGAGGGYGFDGISEIGGLLEIAGHNSDAAGILEQVEALASYLDRVDVTYGAA